MKTKLYIGCGPPGAGKSYYFCRFMNNLISKGEKVAYVSRDRIRFALLDSKDEYFDYEDEVWKIFVKKIQKKLDANCPTVIADATHLTPKARTKLLDALNLHNTEIIPVSFEMPTWICIKQNKLRKNSDYAYVPKGIVRRMNEQFVYPTFDEKYKYAEIIRINKKEKKRDLPDQ